MHQGLMNPKLGRVSKNLKIQDANLIFYKCIIEISAPMSGTDGRIKLSVKVKKDQMGHQPDHVDPEETIKGLQGDSIR